ncbi:hypothetical protein VPIG_00210 [Vibrio phage PWH3a-P1]|uniref:hypothetical protein n=1 Tax=Vibrio phage PWH3a-P1 TaxID=754058 RepID=UPI0002C09418|nr:hypothetical protein VPIG_00210 [Vibrio phage PWH3a-P1]AGH32066.1 hypothetical protein VPIG_00210 [Vibrio phage PWH3a-P1]
MWYLILCFALFLFLSDNTISNKILSLTFTLYLTRLEFSSTFTLNEYLLWTISLLHLFWFHTYLNFKKVYLIDTVLVSCVKIFELCVIVLPFVSLYLPEIIAQHLFKMDNIFLLGVITCLVVRETGYSLKADVVDLKKFYLLFSVVMLHIIAYVF